MEDAELHAHYSRGVAVVLEVARQVLVRVLPPARALNVDLAAAHLRRRAWR
jgi:hypothetical protein